MLKLFEKCPACGGPLVVTECRCTNCQLKLQGEFRPDLFSTLTLDQLTFVRTFLRVRGNQSEMEKNLGVSYPTIRNKLDEINLTLDSVESTIASQSETVPTAIPTVSNVPGETRRAILNQVATGQLNVAQALEQLQALAKSP